METKKDSEALRSEAVRMARVRQLWQASSERHAVQTGILNFSKWLEEHHPELFPPGPGDPYQRLSAELTQEGETAAASPAEAESK